jgi:hypothetical protein
MICLRALSWNNGKVWNIHVESSLSYLYKLFLSLDVVTRSQLRRAHFPALYKHIH